MRSSELNMTTKLYPELAVGTAQGGDLCPDHRQVEDAGEAPHHELKSKKCSKEEKRQNNPYRDGHFVLAL
jgi:hypothetical protein